MDLGLLVHYLPKLKELGISKVKAGEFEFEFHVEKTPAGVAATVPHTTPAATPATGPLETVKVQDMVLPNGLDEEMNFDKILNWSAPVDEGPVPLTNDTPMGELPEVPHG